jgi:hypothetical protein
MGGWGTRQSLLKLERSGFFVGGCDSGWIRGRGMGDGNEGEWV